MPSYPATPFNDRWTVPEFGDPSRTLIDGLGGHDILDFDRLLQSRFIITMDDSTGYVHVDSVSGASSTFHLKLKNVEKLTFNDGRDVVNLVTLFADTTAPEITGFTPTNAAREVKTDSNITLNFNEVMSMGNGGISLHDSSGAMVENFSTSSLIVSGTQLIINPANDLQYGQQYSLVISAGAVMDRSGNSFAGHSVYEFTTIDNTPPIALSAQFILQEDSVLNATLPPASDAESQPLTYTLTANPGHGSIVVNADGSFSYTPASNYSGPDSFSYTVSDGEMASVATTVSFSITPVVDRILGTSADDTLTGNLDGDILQGSAGNDILDGRAGLDFGLFNGPRENYEILSIDGKLTITDTVGSDGTDTLINLERLIFDDQAIAFDLDGNAGTIAKLLGLVLGKDSWHNEEYIGIGLDLLDNNSNISFEALMQSAFNVVLGSNPSDEDVVSLIYNNLIGQAPSQEELNTLVADLLDSGAYTQGSLGVLAADHELNASNINLVGIADSGLEYFPLV